VRAGGARSHLGGEKTSTFSSPLHASYIPREAINIEVAELSSQEILPGFSFTVCLWAIYFNFLHSTIFSSKMEIKFSSFEILVRLKQDSKMKISECHCCI
jgi:hypothetical protein